ISLFKVPNSELISSNSTLGMSSLLFSDNLNTISKNFDFLHSFSNSSNLLFGTNLFCFIILSPPVVPSLLPVLSLVCHFLLPMWLKFQNNDFVVVQGSLSLLLKDFQVND